MTTQREGRWLYPLLAVVATAGFFYVNIMPAIVDGLVTGLGFSNPQAGMIGAANIYGASVGSFLAIFLVGRLRWRPTLAVLFCVLIAIDLASIAIRDPMVLVAVRAVHGIVGGTAVGISYSVIARTHSPDRAFGMLLLVQFGLGGLGVMLLPGLVPVYGTQVLFLSLAALTVVALAALPTIRIAPTTPATAPVTKAVPAAMLALARIRRHAIATLALLALFLFQAGNMAMAAFIIGLGEHYGLARDFISQALGWATWVGATGAILVIVIGIRYGRLRPLLVAGALTLAGCTLFLESGNGWLFFIANVGTAITWSFVVPYLFGMLSALDGSGRMAALGGFASKLGLASGPLAAGWLVRGGDFPLLIIVSVVVIAASVAAATAAALRIDRKESIA